MLRNKGYIFTNKEQSRSGIMSTILGALSMGALIGVVYLTYQNKGQAELKYGSTALLALIFAVVGLVCGIHSRMEPDKFYLFSYLGILFNVLVLLGCSLILFAGAYGL